MLVKPPTHIQFRFAFVKILHYTRRMFKTFASNKHWDTHNKDIKFQNKKLLFFILFVAIISIYSFLLFAKNFICRISVTTWRYTSCYSYLKKKKRLIYSKRFSKARVKFSIQVYIIDINYMRCITWDVSLTKKKFRTNYFCKIK